MDVVSQQACGCNSFAVVIRMMTDVPPISQKPQVCACLRIRGAKLHNLKAVDAFLPLNCLVSVTGVSGLEKLSFILDTLGKYQEHRKFADEIEGLDAVARIIEVDQKGAGWSSRSNVATYTDLFSPIRRILSIFWTSPPWIWFPGRTGSSIWGRRAAIGVDLWLPKELQNS